MLTKVPINHFAKVGSGQGAPQRETDFSETGIPFIRAGSLEDLLNGMDEYELPKVNEEIAKEYRLKLYQPNTIVFAKSGMSALKGRIYKLKNPCYVVNHLATLELKENAIPDYVIYTLRYFSPVKLINDNAYPSLKQSVIENYELPFPKDKDVQLHIANLLSKAENLIAQRKESIRLLDEFLKSTFLEMFGDPVRNEKGWKVKIFEEFTERITKGESPKWQGFDYIVSGVRFITSENVLWGSVDLQKAKFIHEDFHKKLKRSQLKENDLLVNLVGASVGRTSLCPKEALPANINQAVAAITLNPELINEVYVMHLFINPSFQRLLLGNVVEAARANLSLSDLRNLKFPVPPIELQTQFAQIVEKTEALKTQYQQSLQELENLYGSLSQKAFRGELTTKQYQ